MASQMTTWKSKAKDGLGQNASSALRPAGLLSPDDAHFGGGRKAKSSISLSSSCHRIRIFV